MGKCNRSETIEDMRKMIKDAPDFGLNTKTINQGLTALHLVCGCEKPANTQLLVGKSSTGQIIWQCTK